MSHQRRNERPTVGRLTVPFMVDATRQPIDFKALDAEHVERCAKHSRCGVCGRRIHHGRPVALIGPADGRSCYADPWMHPECADLAMAQCPFLRGTRDWRQPGGSLLQPYSDGMVVRVVAEARSHRDALGAWHFEVIR
jgi:hypothetical protein